MDTTLKKYIWILGLVAVITISYLMAKITTLYIAGMFPDEGIRTAVGKGEDTAVAQQAAAKADVGLIIKKNFFDPNETLSTNTKDTTKPTNENNQDPNAEKNTEPTNDEAVPTKLSIKLISTISLGDGKSHFCSAVIESDKKMATYFVDGKESFSTDAKIVRILPRRVEFTNKGQLEYVTLEEFAKNSVLTDKPTPVVPTMIKKNTDNTETPPEDPAAADTIVQKGDSFQIARSEIKKALANMAKLYTDIRAVPFFEGGMSRGLKILSVKPGSLFDKLGIRRGDVLKTVNGKDFDLQSGLKYLEALENESEIVIEVDRRGENKSLKYEII